MDHIVSAKLASTSIEIEQKFDKGIQAKLETIRTENAVQLKAQTAALEATTDHKLKHLDARLLHTGCMATGMALDVEGLATAAATSFRNALELYVGRREAFTGSVGRTTCWSVFHSIKSGNPANLTNAIRTEIETHRELYEQLHTELAAAAVEIGQFPELAEVVREFNNPR